MRNYPTPAPARRFMPRRGEFLTLENIRGPWRPSGTVGGMGVFAVVWTSPSSEFWAPLHDFAPADQLRLIEACRHNDQGRLRDAWNGGY